LPSFQYILVEAQILRAASISDLYQNEEELACQETLSQNLFFQKNPWYIERILVVNQLLPYLLCESSSSYYSSLTSHYNDSNHLKLVILVLKIQVSCYLIY